ncbi:MAG: hypothetical protein PCFJNLEI_01650 [Verrucomicrobiae bacterium]|nr:hypothetical protein [Verrucomicrobiae bacterium]
MFEKGVDWPLIIMNTYLLNYTSTIVVRGLALGLVLTVGGVPLLAGSVVLVDAKTRNGSFEASDKGVPAWTVVQADCEAAVTNTPPGDATHGKRCVALHSVVSSARSAFGYIVNVIPLKEANGPHFELEWTAWSAEKNPFQSRAAYLVFFRDKQVVQESKAPIDQGPISTKPQKFRVVHTLPATGWDHVELRLILMRHGQPGTVADGFVDAVTLRQLKELPRKTGS